MLRWSTKSLDERVALIKKKFPHAHVTIYKLRKLYRINKIKLKKIRFTKIIIDRRIPNIQQDLFELIDDIRSALLHKFRII